MSNWTIVPVRGLASGKSRLAGVLGPEERLALNTLLLERVLDAVARCDGSLSQCIVAAGGADVVERIEQLGGQAITLRDGPEPGLNAALNGAREIARSKGASSILVLAADLPEANPKSLLRLHKATPQGHASVIPDRHGTGTNGLLLPANCDVEFTFGEGSLTRHIAAIRATGVEVAACNDDALAFDLDTPADYREWRSAIAERSVDGHRGRRWGR